MKRRFLSVVVVAIFMLIGWYWFSTKHKVTSNPMATEAPRIGSGGPLYAIAPPSVPAKVDPGSFTSEQARAFAALGEVIDGQRKLMPTLVGVSPDVVENMRRLLASQPVYRGFGQPTVSRDGATARIDGGGASASIAKEPASDHLPNGDGRSSNTSPPTTADGERNLLFGRSNGSVITKDGEHTITGKAAWAAIQAIPGQGLPIRIVDHGEGGHVIAVFGDDFGSVRVNGGLVVPGRYYLIKGSIEISSMSPIGVHIRPLSAVPAYHDQPLMSPNANG
jgi:hypothetical protein